MVNIDKESLEKALNSGKIEEPTTSTPPAPKSNEGVTEGAEPLAKEEETGFHKGSLNTLAAERNELFKMVQNVEAIMQAHIKRLEELGVKIDTQKKEE